MSPLSDDEVDAFVRRGFVRLDEAFTRRRATAAVSAILAGTGVDLGDPATWPGPVLRVDGSTDPAVTATIDTSRLGGAIDQLVGRGRWQRRTSGFGTFPIRFPSDEDPGDAGWHIDGSFGDPPHFLVNLASRGRALLLLMLFTDVGHEDAPTRLRVGSHVPVARALARLGCDVTFVPQLHAPESLDLHVEHATGPAGTVYLCHPFLVHAAGWPHTGSSPRVLGQPAIHHPEGEWLGGFRYDDTDPPPVQRAVRHVLDAG